MIKKLRPVEHAMSAILNDTRSTRIERILAGQIILSLNGLLLPLLDDRWLTSKQTAQLRRIQQDVVDHTLRRREQRRRANRKQYLKRRIKQLEGTHE